MKIRLYKFCRKVWALLSRDYSKELKNPSHKILVCYLSSPFYNENKHKYMVVHQNRRETLIMASVFEELNWSYRFTRLDKPLIRNINKYDIIFGCGSTFVMACNKNEHAKKIYYATGSYYKHQNEMIKLRTDEFNKKHHSSIEYSRLAIAQNSNEVANGIIQIGSKFTIETYPNDLRSKIIPIHQTSFDFSMLFDRQKKIHSYNKNSFIYMGSKGSILKGLDIVLDYFETHHKLTVHLFGIIDSDFSRIYYNQLNNCPNIINHGYTDLSSKIFLEIAYECAWVMLPSVSEGCPGSVINCMKVGCIPIISKYAACEESEEVGLVMEKADINSLSNAIDIAQSMSAIEIENRINAAIDIASQNYNDKVFCKEFKNAINKIISL